METLTYTFPFVPKTASQDSYIDRQKKPGRHTTKKEYSKFEREAVYNGGAYACDDLRAGQTVSVFSHIEFGLPVYRIYFKDGLSIFVPEEDLNFPPSSYVYFKSDGTDTQLDERDGEIAFVTGYHKDSDNELVHDLTFRDGFTCSAKTKDLDTCYYPMEFFI